MNSLVPIVCHILSIVIIWILGVLKKPKFEACDLYDNNNVISNITKKENDMNKKVDAIRVHDQVQNDNLLNNSKVSKPINKGNVLN